MEWQLSRAARVAVLVVIAGASGPILPGAVEPRTALAAAPAAEGSATVSGELRQWHAVTLDLTGPFARERDSDPNPFLDYRLTVTFAHESGEPRYVVPGYFAADGRAAETGAEAGDVWRAYVSPDVSGRWTYEVAFVRGRGVAVSGDPGEPVEPLDGATGSFEVLPTDKAGRDFRARGRLEYVGQHHLRFAGSGEYFLKAGPDSPETFLASADFDGTVALKDGVPLKTWQPHVRDWREGDPTWRDGRGKGLIGALNYLAGNGLNSFSFLPYNAGGDGDDVWPFVGRDEKLHYDCSKLDQWGIVFAHAQRMGLYLHFKLQETEIDDERGGGEREAVDVPEALDGGALGPERKLYLRELIARFGHHLALNWNLGEENTQTAGEQRAMARFIADTDPYDHHRVIHTYPNEQERVYEPLLGSGSVLTGASLQNDWSATHARTYQWVSASARAGRPWVVANDEQGPASLGAPPDPGYEGFDGTADWDGEPYDLHDIRRDTLWGNLMAGGAGVEYYFGYRLPQNDLVAEDFRSRERTWEYSRIALELFEREEIPFWRMRNADELVGNPGRENTRYCLALPGALYLVYLPRGGEADLDLSGAAGQLDVSWFDPRSGGPLVPAAAVQGGGRARLVAPSAEDWLAIVRSRSAGPGAAGKSAGEVDDFRPRVVHTTDLGADPDDQMSLVRHLVMANGFETEGLVVSTGCWRKSQSDTAMLDAVIDAYGQVVANLKVHDPAFPSVESLRSVAVLGQTGYGMSDVGDGKDSAGSELIIAAVDEDDPRPLWATCWGGCNTIAQALWKVRRTRSADELAAFVRRLHVYDVLGQDDAGTWIAKTFPEILYIRATRVYDWQPSDEWVDTHVQSHGPLGAAYPDPPWAYEGDSPAIFHLAPNGLHDPTVVDQGGWGGRFAAEKKTGVRGMRCMEGEDARYDPYGMYNEASESISRWREALQNDFEARMDWSVTGRYADANHHPTAILNGDETRRVLTVSAPAGSDVELSAAGSSDPDGDELSYSWWFYEEPSSHDGPVAIRGDREESATVEVSAGARGRSLHVVLEIQDDGAPRLTAYRRMIIDVQ